MQILICNIDKIKVSIFLLRAVVFQCYIFIVGGIRQNISRIASSFILSNLDYIGGYRHRFPP